MWAISSIPSQASWLPPTATKSCRSHTVSAKPRRHENKNLNDDEVKSNPKSVSSPISNNPKQVIIKGGESDSEDKGVGGSDILWALQKASAQKPTTKVKKKKRASSKSKGGDGDEKRDVKALSIRLDWSKRLDDLERRLRDLTDTSS